MSSVSPEPFQWFPLNFIWMFLSVRRSAEPMTWVNRLKVTLQGHGFSLSCVHSISHEPFDSFSLNLTKMLLSVRRNAEFMTQLCRLKVTITVQGHWIYCWISCLLHISWTFWKSFITLSSNIHHCMQTHASATQTQGPGHTSRSWSHFKVMEFTLGFCVHSISPECIERFSLNFAQIFLSVRRCAKLMTRLHRLKVKLAPQGGICRSSSCPLHISWTLWTIKQLRVPLSETVCRTIDSHVQTPCQGHTSRSWEYLWVSCLLHFLNKILSNVCANEPQHEISNNVVYVTSTASDQPVHAQFNQSLC